MKCRKSWYKEKLNKNLNMDLIPIGIVYIRNIYTLFITNVFKHNIIKTTSVNIHVFVLRRLILYFMF
jgi:hypothetical protein